MDWDEPIPVLLVALMLFLFGGLGFLLYDSQQSMRQLTSECIAQRGSPRLDGGKFISCDWPQEPRK